MGVQKDAGELLLFFYDMLVNKGESTVGTQEVLTETNWDGKRINFAYNYLNDLGILKSGGGCGNIKSAQIFFVMRLLPNGINIIENQPEFKRNFGFEVNLGLIKFSWGLSEK
ncbi:hypothetical protein HN924_02210 [Candidatus Woesearchaeota archaeon]|jgi:hypothetical protein|nr:hypothetical protein [Candidatus Woesearchaeota archaeon]MBT7062758.1 hypothetical protein [Candidatus Woesearchaeota archaeon]MBT7402401.1 hypothetical protein [Candidatus Woesearchaeota archaeon]